MKITVIEGPHTKERIQQCYHLILKYYRKAMMEELKNQSITPDITSKP